MPHWVQKWCSAVRVLNRYIASLSSPWVMRKLSMLPVTATAPRMRQTEQVHRRAEARPCGSSAVNFTAPQWQEPLRVIGSDDLVLITVPPARDELPPVRNGGFSAEARRLLDSSRCS